MLSEKTVKALTNLKYRSDSDWSVNILPFGSIFWHDEMLKMADLLEQEGDSLIIHRMFAIRIKIWDGEVLDDQERKIWDSVKLQLPDWALFKRLTLSPEQKLAREQAERQVEQAFEPHDQNLK